MMKMREVPIGFICRRLILLLCLGLLFTACNLPIDEGSDEEDTGISETSTPALSGADAQEESYGSGDVGRMQCPADDYVIPVEYLHLLKMNLPGGNLDVYGDTDVVFYLTIRGNGVIDSEDFNNWTPTGNWTTLAISGKIDDCTIEGEVDLSAEFEGTCIDGLVDIFFVGKLHNILTISSCPGQDPQRVELPGMFSAPEERIKFEFTDETHTHVLQLDTSLEKIDYQWVFKLQDLGIVPLVPE